MYYVIKKFGLNLNILILLGFFFSCSELENSDLRNEGDSEDFLEDPTLPPANTTGAYLTSCDVNAGLLACSLKNPSNDNKVILSDFNLSPKYDLWVSRDVNNDTPESLEAAGANKHTGESTYPGVDATFIFAFSDLQDYLYDTFAGGDKFNEAERQSNKIGNILTYTLDDYAPKNADGEVKRKSVIIGRCLMGVLLDSWKNSSGEAVIQTNYEFEDLSGWPYPGDSAAAKDVDPIDGNYLPQWEVAIDEITSIYINNVPTDLEPDEVYECKANYDKYKAGEENTLFSELEFKLGALIKDYLGYQNVDPSEEKK